MPKTSGRKKATAKTGRRQLTRAQTRRPETLRPRRDPHKATLGVIDNSRETDHPFIIQNDQLTHVLVPVDEYEELIKASMVASAIAKLDDPASEYVDADDFALELAAEQIANARKAKGLTQKQLGEKLRLPQSQISRIERNPDRTTVRTLKRIARALGVDVSALI